MRRKNFATDLALAGLVRTNGALAQTPRKGRLKRCVTAGVFDPKMPLEDQRRLAAELGCACFDLVRARGDRPVRRRGMPESDHILG
jgi:hypothetical protein